MQDHDRLRLVGLTTHTAAGGHATEGWGARDHHLATACIPRCMCTGSVLIPLIPYRGACLADSVQDPPTLGTALQVFSKPLPDKEALSSTPPVFSAPFASPMAASFAASSSNARPTTAPTRNETSGLGETSRAASFARRPSAPYQPNQPRKTQDGRPATATVTPNQPSRGGRTPGARPSIQTASQEGAGGSRTAWQQNSNLDQRGVGRNSKMSHLRSMREGSAKSASQKHRALRPQTARDLAGGERVRFLKRQADRKDDGYPYRR